MNKNPYTILGLSNFANKDDIKKAYKEIALSCHPDKLINIIDETEKNEKINKFKEASEAYKKLLNNDDEINYWDDTKDWKYNWFNLFNNDTTTDIIKDTFIDLATMFINNNIKPKSYYTPKTDIINHECTLYITYNELYTNFKKRVRLVLLNIEEPVFIDIFCNSYPKIIKQFIDENDKEHEIILNIELKSFNNYDHIENEDNSINLITSIEITLLEYIMGCEKNILYIDNNNLNIIIPPFQQNPLEIKNKGLKNGSLIIDIIIKNINNNIWNSLSNKNKDDMIRLLDIIYNNN